MDFSIQIFLSVLGLILGAILFRIRGGAFGDEIRKYIYKGYGATTSRLVVWSLPMTFLLFFSQPYHIWWVYLLFFLAMYLGTIIGWWRSIDMGRVEGKWLPDFIFQTLRGVLWTLPAAAVMFYVGSISTMISLLIAGALCGVLYELGWRVKLPKSIAESKFDLRTGPELGELFFGAAIGLAITL